jgi:RND family efflux transporter MFP subunit
MRKRLVSIVILLVLVAAGAGLILVRKRSLRDLQPPASPPRPVAVAPVKQGTAAEVIRTVALVQSDTSATVAAQVGGVLLEVRRREGDRVGAGELLARIEPRTLDDAVATAQARLAAATEDLARLEAVQKRDEALFAGKAISRQVYDASRAQLEGARAIEVAARRSLDSARTSRAYADIVAPQAGVVTARLVEPGDMAAPGKPLFVVQARGQARLLSKLSQDALARLAPGVGVTFSDGARELAGRVTRVYPALDASRLGSVETVLPEPPFGLPPGAVVAAAYQSRPAEGLVVPNSALLGGLHETVVVRLDEGKARPVPVIVLARGDRDAVVRGDVAAGDLVVTGLASELMALTAGTPLRAVDAPAQPAPALSAPTVEARP